MPKMTKPQFAKLAKLEAARECATQAVYAASGRTDVRFNDCYAMAAPETQLTYMSAISVLETFRQEMISAGRAYPGAFGMFTPNT